MSQADSPTTTIRPTAPAEADVSTAKIIALLGGLQPHRISVLRGATSADIDEVGEQVNHAFNLLASYLARTLPNLNANIRSGMIAFDPALRALADIRSDLLGQISDAAERAEGA